MNKYCQHNIEKFYRSFVDRTFDQDDVSLFLAVSRDYTAKGSVLRELGDFIAHPVEKDRGLIIKEIQRIAPVFDEFLDRYRKRTLDDDVEMLPTFNGIQQGKILNDLKSIFKKANISIDVFDEDGDSFRELVACIIIMLEPCKLLVNKKSLQLEVIYGHRITALIKYESDCFLNHFASLPVLTLYNVNTSWNSPFRDGFRLTNKIARRSKSFGLVAISYEDDLKEGFLDRDSYRAGEIWPLNPK